MIRMFSRHLLKGLWAMGLLLFFSLSILGCDSQDLGETEVEEPVEDDPIVVDRDVSEACAVCHAGGKLASVEAIHFTSPGSVSGAIGDVRVIEGAGGGRFMEVLFSLSEDGQPLVGADPSSIRFTVARLMPGLNGDASAWRSYINDVETHEAGDPGTTPAGFTSPQATYERASAEGGTFMDNRDGTYSYQFSFDFTSVTAPLEVPYNPEQTHLVAMQVADNIDNPYFTFRPSDGAVSGIDTRQVAVTASCNDCHQDLAFHGGDRKAMAYCVTCHNPDTADANSGNTVDMKVMIHKIHRGANLPSVEAGEPYTIWGFRNSEHDYSDVHLPMDIRNCTECHDNGDNPETQDTPDGDNWKTVPTMEACGSCHDNISFERPVPDDMALHTGGPIESNLNCAGCHPADRIVSYHRIPQRMAAADFEYQILSVENTSPGQRPRVTFSVTDPSNGDMPWDILADPPFTAPDGASRLAVLIGWDAENYDNLGSENYPAQPVSINALTDAVENTDGTFTVTSPVAIPNYVTGTGAAALEGHPAADPDGDGLHDLRVPVKNVLQYFAITDAQPDPRREVVDIEGCNDCHETLAVHGDNRTDEPQVCVICHNSNATDIQQRPEDAAGTTDGRREQAIDLKFIIHGIHGAGMREEPLVVYGFGGREHVFDEVHYPGDPANCYACHIPGTYDLPLPEAVEPTTVDTGEDIAIPADDRIATPVTITCGACHDGEVAELHMLQNGGSFDIGPPVQQGDGDDAGDGGGEIIQPPGHPTSPNCTTAFECHG